MDRRRDRRTYRLVDAVALRSKHRGVLSCQEDSADQEVMVWRDGGAPMKFGRGRWDMDPVWLESRQGWLSD